MQIERVDHHEIVGQAEILHRQPLAIDQAAVADFVRHEARTRSA
jgi:hypothetical protein